jgi:phosphoserine aminotransferase
LKEKGELSEEDLVAELRKKVDSELRLDYLVTGSEVTREILWSSSN